MNLDLRKEGRADDRARGARPSTVEGGALRRLFVLFAFLAILTVVGLLGLDRVTAEAVRAHEPRWLFSISSAISLLGGIGIYPATAAALLAWFWWFRPDRRLSRVCIWLLTAEAACALLVRMLKIGFGRWRPDQVLGGQFEFFQLKSKCHSFPSGHTADAAVVATVLWIACPRLRPLCVVWVALMAMARIGAEQHFVADAATGAALGILGALAVGRKLDAIDRRIVPGTPSPMR